MVKNMKKSPHTAEYKFKVALEAIRGNKTTAELCSEYGIVSSQLFKWKKAVLDQGAEVFKSGSTVTHDQGLIDKLHTTIGRLKVENDFLEQCLGRRP
jgi:transposase-like protein